MRYLNFVIILLTSMIFMQACKRHDVEVPDFGVAALKTAINVNDSIIFNFSGNPDNIVFFSGEQGKKYQYRNRVREAGKAVLKFSSSRANGNQPGSLSVLVSADFSGLGTDSAGTANNIAKANWVDVTSRAVLSSGPLTASGDIDLSDIANNDKPVYVAFKYAATPGTPQPKWSISELSVTNTLADASKYTIANLTATAITNYEVATIFSPGWVGYRLKNSYAWTISSGKSMVITGATSTATSTAPSEAWVFAGPLDLRKVSPDYGIFVKDITTRASRFPFKYANAGTYSSAFVASINNIYGKAEVVKNIDVNVE